MIKIKEIKEKAQITGEDNENWRDKVMLVFSPYLTKLFLCAPITANQVTLLSLLTGVIAAAFFIPGVYIFSLLGIFLFHLSELLDFSDGEVARFKKITSKRGVYLDYMTHIIVYPALYFCISIGAYKNNFLPIPNWIFLVTGVFTLYFYMLNQFARLKKYEMYIDKGETKKLVSLKKGYKQPYKGQGTLKKELADFIRINPFNIILVCTILNILPIYVILNALLQTGYSIVRIYKEFINEEGPKKN